MIVVYDLSNIYHWYIDKFIIRDIILREGNYLHRRPRTYRIRCVSHWWSYTLTVSASCSKKLLQVVEAAREAVRHKYLPHKLSILYSRYFEDSLVGARHARSSWTFAPCRIARQIRTCFWQVFSKNCPATRKVASGVWHDNGRKIWKMLKLLDNITRLVIYIVCQNILLFGGTRVTENMSIFFLEK